MPLMRTPQNKPRVLRRRRGDGGQAVASPMMAQHNRQLQRQVLTSPATQPVIQRQDDGGEEENFTYGVEGFRFEPGGETCPDTPVNDSTVSTLIADALAEAGDDPASAFAALRAEREGECCDVNLAAAEHYMYARLQVQTGESSYTSMVAQIMAYDTGKAVMPDALIPRTGDCPPTPVSQAQMTWALAGASAGDSHREED